MGYHDSTCFTLSVNCYSFLGVITGGVPVASFTIWNSMFPSTDRLQLKIREPWFSSYLIRVRKWMQQTVSEFKLISPILLSAPISVTLFAFDYFLVFFLINCSPVFRPRVICQNCEKEPICLLKVFRSFIIFYWMFQYENEDYFEKNVYIH